MSAEVPIERFESYVAGLDHPGCLAFDGLGDLWVGTESGQVYRISPERKVVPVTQLNGFCAGLAFSPKDELVAAVPAMGLFCVSASGEVSPFGSRAVTGIRCGVFDASGVFYATVPGQWGRKNGYLLRIRPNSEVETVAGPMGYLSSLALSVDGTEIFMTESDTNSVFRVVLSGASAKPEVYCCGCGRVPTGLALDVEGSLYVSCFASDEIWRISRNSEKSLIAYDEWSIRLSSPTCLAFGGAELGEIYVCNMARPHIGRARIGHKGQPMANQRVRRSTRPRPAPL